MMSLQLHGGELCGQDPGPRGEEQLVVDVGIGGMQLANDLAVPIPRHAREQIQHEEQQKPNAEQQQDELGVTGQGEEKGRVYEALGARGEHVINLRLVIRHVDDVVAGLAHHIL